MHVFDKVNILKKTTDNGRQRQTSKDDKKHGAWLGHDVRVIGARAESS